MSLLIWSVVIVQFGFITSLFQHISKILSNKLKFLNKLLILFWCYKRPVILIFKKHRWWLNRRKRFTTNTIFVTLRAHSFKFHEIINCHSSKLKLWWSITYPSHGSYYYSFNGNKLKQRENSCTISKHNNASNNEIVTIIDYNSDYK